MGQIYLPIKYSIYPLIRRYIKSIEGIENLSKEGCYIIAANHASYIDDFIFSCIPLFHTNKHIHIFVKDRYFKNYFIRKFLEYGECIPIYIDKSEKAKSLNGEALIKAADYLKYKDIVGIFPEGTRSPDGILQKGKIGVARLALSAKVPVIPYGIIGSSKILPKGAIFPRFKRCEVKIGKPIYFDKFYGKNDKKTYEEVTRIVMKEIAKLIGQEYNY